MRSPPTSGRRRGTHRHGHRPPHFGGQRLCGFLCGKRLGACLTPNQHERAQRAMEEGWCGGEAHLIIRGIERHDHIRRATATSDATRHMSQRSERGMPHDGRMTRLFRPLPCEPSNYHRPGFRFAVHPADCAPPARAVGLFAKSCRSTRRRRDRAAAPAGIILSGGPSSVSEAGAPRCDPACFRRTCPVLGICYGMQLMTDALGGEVAPAPHREFGHATIQHRSRTRRCFARRPVELRVWASHGDFVKSAPRGLRGHRDERERAGRGDGGRGSQLLRAAVPPRSRAHRSRHRHPPQLRVRHLRLHRRLDDGVVRAGGDRNGSARRWGTGASSAA